MRKLPSDVCNKDLNQPVQFDLNFHRLHEETLHPWLIKICPVKILIRLLECPGWEHMSEDIFSDGAANLFTYCGIMSSLFSPDIFDE